MVGYVEMYNKNRVARVSIRDGRYTVWVGFQGNREGDEPVAALYFKDYRTCSASFATEKTAYKKAKEFLNR